VNFETSILLAFAAGNFVYISASDLIPEITHGLAHKFEKPFYSLKTALISLSWFIIGLLIILTPKWLLNK